MFCCASALVGFTHALMGHIVVSGHWNNPAKYWWMHHMDICSAYDMNINKYPQSNCAHISRYILYVCITNKVFHIKSIGSCWFCASHVSTLTPNWSKTGVDHGSRLQAYGTLKKYSNGSRLVLFYVVWCHTFQAYILDTRVVNTQYQRKSM